MRRRFGLIGRLGRSASLGWLLGRRELDMTTERQAQVRQPFELTEDRAADVATMARRNWVPVGHTHEDIDGVFVGAMAHLRELALGQQPERGAPEP